MKYPCCLCNGPKMKEDIKEAIKLGLADYIERREKRLLNQRSVKIYKISMQKEFFYYTSNPNLIKVYVSLY